MSFCKWYWMLESDTGRDVFRIKVEVHFSHFRHDVHTYYTLTKPLWLQIPWSSHIVELTALGHRGKNSTWAITAGGNDLYSTILNMLSVDHNLTSCNLVPSLSSFIPSCESHSCTVRFWFGCIRPTTRSLCNNYYHLTATGTVYLPPSTSSKRRLRP